MRIRQRRAPLGLLLLSSLAVASAVASSSDSVPLNPATGSSSKIGTKDAPVDGKDGRPHEGPFVEVEHLTSGSDLKKLPPLEGRPADPTIVDGVKIPQTNDGVMNDPDRSQAKEGTTGTSGGVSEKDQARKAKEGATGEKAENKPESPKEAPPLPHSEQEKILSKPDGKSEDFSGFEVRANLHWSLHAMLYSNVLTVAFSRNLRTSLARPPNRHSLYPTLRTRTTSMSLLQLARPRASCPSMTPKA
jgi:hypothetical protein